MYLFRNCFLSGVLIILDAIQALHYRCHQAVVTPEKKFHGFWWKAVFFTATKCWQDYQALSQQLGDHAIPQPGIALERFWLDATWSWTQGSCGGHVVTVPTGLLGQDYEAFTPITDGTARDWWYWNQTTALYRSIRRSVKNWINWGVSIQKFDLKYLK